MKEVNQLLIASIISLGRLSTRGLVAGLCALAIMGAGGGVNDRVNDRLQPIGSKDSFTLRYDGGTGTVRLFVVAAGPCLYSLPTKGLVERQDVNKLQFPRDIPLIGKLFTPYVRSQDFRHSPIIGDAYFYDGVLTLQIGKRTQGPHAAGTTDMGSLIDQFESSKASSTGLPAGKYWSGQPRYIIVAHQNYAYGVRADNVIPVIDRERAECPGIVDGLATANVILWGMYDSGALTEQWVGTVHDHGDGLLVLVKPSIIDPARPGLF